METVFNLILLAGGLILTTLAVLFITAIMSAFMTTGDDNSSRGIALAWLLSSTLSGFLIILVLLLGDKLWFIF